MIQSQQHIHFGKALCWCAALMLGLAACGGDPDSCFKSAGSEATETRSITVDFQEIVVEGKIDLVLFPAESGTQQDITLQGGENLLEFIETEVEGKQLRLSVNTTCNFFRSYKKRFQVRVPFSADVHLLNILTDARVNSADTLVFDSLRLLHQGTDDAHLLTDCRFLDAEIQNLGSISLDGRASIFASYINDAGGLDAGDYNAAYNFVAHYGINDVYVYAEKGFGIENYRSGRVFYRGDPWDFFQKANYGGGHIGPAED